MGLNDPSPFTLSAFVLAIANKQGISWDKVSGTSNQSDYLSHYVANHMFYRFDLPGSRRIIGDHIEFMLKNVPRWNPLSIIGQHIQQAGATPAEAMALTISSGIQYADDCLARGMDPEFFLPRFSFFFDISISFFEEIAKFRAGRRVWAKITQERYGAKTDRARRFRFHAQTSGVDLTRQQPLNNISRVTVQAMSGIFGGLQSLHTDAYDEALSTPSEKAARIAVNTQNILKEEAGLTDVIDPLGGSYYVEKLTDQMEENIFSIIGQIDEAFGMYKAVESGIVQSMIGRSAKEFQDSIDSGKQKIVSVNAYQADEDNDDRPVFERPAKTDIDNCIQRLKDHKSNRSQQSVKTALSNLTKAADSTDQNVFSSVIKAAEAGVTHGEIVGTLRKVYGLGQPLIRI
ncbi:MAG: methylmalonyl-CoA mutase, partial [Gammaproteobacteria bacterium]